MWHWLSRILLLVVFLGVLLGVAAPNVQGQAPDAYKIALPVVAQRVVLTQEPALRDYVGLLYASPNNTAEGAFYTVRGDGSDWRQLTAEGAILPDAEWSPDGRYLLYFQDSTSNLLRLSDQAVIATFPYIPAHHVWSPDSQSLFLYNGWRKSAIYEVGLGTLREADGEFLLPTEPTWSPDSQFIAWLADIEDSPDRALWLWQRDMPNPTLQLTDLPGLLQWEHLSWSPTSEQIALKGESYLRDEQQTIITTMDGSANDVVLDDYLFHGWVAGGSRGVLQQAGRLYLASPDGTEIVPFSNPDQDLTNATISVSDQVLLYRVDNTLFFHPIGQESPVALEAGYCGEDPDCFETFTWKADGTRFLRTYGVHNPQNGWSILEVWDSTRTPPRLMGGFDANGVSAPRFLPYSADYISKTSQDSGLATSYILNVRTNIVSRIPYDLNGQWGIYEWRYMP